MKKETIKTTIIIIIVIIFIVNGILGLTLLSPEKLTLFWKTIFIFNIVTWSCVLGYLYGKNR